MARRKTFIRRAVTAVVEPCVQAACIALGFAASLLFFRRPPRSRKRKRRRAGRLTRACEFYLCG